VAETGKQSPLGVNTLSSLLLNEGFSINPNVKKYLGSSKSNRFWDHGELVKNTVLRLLTYSITDAYRRGEAGASAVMTNCELKVIVPSVSGILTVGTLESGFIQEGQNVTSPEIDEPGYQIIIVSRIEGDGTNSKWNVALNVIASDYENIDMTAQMNPALETVTSAVYDNILNIGQSRIPALGNTKPPTFIANDPSDQWDGEAMTGYAVPGPTGHGQEAKWMDWNSSAPNSSITQAGFLRTLAYQAWNEFNWNGEPPDRLDPQYKNYTMTFNAAKGFVEYTNDAIMSLRNSKDFLKGTYSNMNDLITADITGVSLSTQAFGQDLINLGKALSLSKIDRFGLPSALLENLHQNGAVPQTLNLTMLSAGLNIEEINNIFSTFNCSKLQEQQLYQAMLNVDGEDLVQALQTLQCKTAGINTLADLLNVKKLFPISFSTLTVPIYNTTPQPTNAKTYYLLFINGLLNPQLLNPAIVQQIGTIVPPADPIIPPAEDPPPVKIIDEQIVNQPPTTPLPKIVGGGGCVVLDAYVPTVETRLHNDKPVEKAWQLEPTFDILLGSDDLTTNKGKVVKALIDFQPCVRIQTASGIRLSCSTTAPILTKENGYVEAPKLFGQRVAVMRNDVTFWDEVVAIDDIGHKHVRVIDTGNNSFWAGDIQNAYILHHNVIVDENRNLNFAKK
jgi:hypothetical protein